MNCKQGEMAFIKNNPNYPEDTDKIVTIKKFQVDGDGSAAWIVEGIPEEYKKSTRWPHLRKQRNWILDAALRPIRDQPGEDEMIRITGKPRMYEVNNTTKENQHV